MVEVDPGCVMAEVLVTVKVKVLVCALNSQTTVAVEKLPLCTPSLNTVSACALTEKHAMRATAPSVRKNLRNRAMTPPCSCPKYKTQQPSAPSGNSDALLGQCSPKYSVLSGRQSSVRGSERIRSRL